MQRSARFLLAALALMLLAAAIWIYVSYGRKDELPSGSSSFVMEATACAA